MHQLYSPFRKNVQVIQTFRWIWTIQNPPSLRGLEVGPSLRYQMIVDNQCLLGHTAQLKKLPKGRYWHTPKAPGNGSEPKRLQADHRRLILPCKLLFYKFKSGKKSQMWKISLKSKMYLLWPSFWWISTVPTLAPGCRRLLNYSSSSDLDSAPLINIKICMAGTGVDYDYVVKWICSWFCVKINYNRKSDQGDTKGNCS